jgi:putative ABC transport system substrate-binding protein
MKHYKHPGTHRLIVLVALVSLFLTACGSAPPAQPQTRIFKIGEISTSSRFDIAITGFKAGMVDQGYVEGKNVAYVFEGVTESAEKRDAAAQKLVAEKVDLIVAFGSPASLAAKKATEGTNIPVVFVPVVDPVKAGLVQSLRNPGGNLTGVTVGADLYTKELDWLLKISPKIKRVYVPYDSPNNPAAALALAAIKEAAPKIGVELVIREIKKVEEVPEVIAEIPSKADAIYLVPGSVHVTAKLDDFLKASLDHKLPLSASVLDWVKNGALLSYSSSDAEAGKQAGRLADRILKGAKPADLPVETAEYFLAINLKTAAAIGLTIPDDILRQATTIVR